jgi:hypothetical protein
MDMVPQVVGTETTFKERHESTRPCDACDGMDMATKGEKHLQQLSHRLLVNI